MSAKIKLMIMMPRDAYRGPTAMRQMTKFTMPKKKTVQKVRITQIEVDTHCSTSKNDFQILNSIIFLIREIVSSIDIFFLLLKF